MLPKKSKIPIILCILMVPILISAAESSSPVPQAYLPESIFEFSPVVEGTEITHEFILHNRGDAPLAVLDLKSG